MSLRSKWSKLKLVPTLLVHPPDFILLLSHMRSRSTLLSHILGSATGIHGYREQHRSYLTGWDLFKLALESIAESEDGTEWRYALDKVLHDDFVIAPHVLGNRDVRFVILVRKPRATIESILRMGELTGIDRHQDPSTAVEHYCRRLHGLLRYIDVQKKRVFFIESDELIQQTDRMLEDLSIWLDLNTPLRPTYDIFESTGKIWRSCRCRG